jgi:transcriptional regulator with XRE-family HTH domain
MNGERMKSIRSELGYTQAQLASLIGGKASMISDYENGRKKITDKLAIIMECLLEINKLGGDIKTVVGRGKGL